MMSGSLERSQADLAHKSLMLRVSEAHKGNDMEKVNL